MKSVKKLQYLINNFMFKCVFFFPLYLEFNCIYIDCYCCLTVINLQVGYIRLMYNVSDQVLPIPVYISLLCPVKIDTPINSLAVSKAWQRSYFKSVEKEDIVVTIYFLAIKNNSTIISLLSKSGCEGNIKI